jgi:hypothetical protein
MNLSKLPYAKVNFNNLLIVEIIVNLYNIVIMVKKVHLSQEEIAEKIEKLEKEKETEEFKNNKSKRKRVYQQLALYKKAIVDPNSYVVDPE